MWISTHKVDIMLLSFIPGFNLRPRLGPFFFFFTPANGVGIQERARTRVGKEPAHAGRKPAHVRREPAQAEKGGIPRVQTLGNQVRNMVANQLSNLGLAKFIFC